MSFFGLFAIAAGLSMDAFAVSVCQGLSLKKMEAKYPLLAGLYFGVFQAVMPLAGYLLGVRFQQAIERFDHWIAFVLLGFIGLSMIRESFSKEQEVCPAAFDFKSMVVMAIATSIDALAVGVTFAFLKVPIIPAVTLIGLTTFCFSAVGVVVGNIFGVRYKAKAEFAGGLMLLFMGSKILLEHLMVLQG